MPDHLKTLIVILTLSSLVFAFAKGPICSLAMTHEDYNRRRNLWYIVTLIAFLSHNFWLYIVATGIVIWLAQAREHNPLALYFTLLFAIPPINAEIGGLGIVEHLFSIDYLRLLALTILLPAWRKLRLQKDVSPFGLTTTDKLLFAFLVLIFLLRFRDFTATDSLRFGFYLFTDTFLPYYVASRALRNLDQFRDAFSAFVLAAMILALLGIFETVKHWMLYTPLEVSLGVNWDYGSYLGRGTTLRAQVTTGQPIVLGFIMVVALGFYGFLWHSIPKQWRIRGLILLIGGLLAPVSRGPWVGAAMLPIVFALTSGQSVRKLVLLGIATAAVAILLFVSPLGDKLISYLPFIGSIDSENITYRKKLVDNSLIVIGQNPLFGSLDALNTAEMEEMRQGGGIIDIVNTYISIALNYGVVGLALFIGILVSMMTVIWKILLNSPNRSAERYRLGQALLATLGVIMLIITTVSSILAIPIVYWSVAGMGVAYARLLAPAKGYEARP